MRRTILSVTDLPDGQLASLTRQRRSSLYAESEKKRKNVFVGRRGGENRS